MMVAMNPHTWDKDLASESNAGGYLSLPRQADAVFEVPVPNITVIAVRRDSLSQVCGFHRHHYVDAAARAEMALLGNP